MLRVVSLLALVVVVSTYPPCQRPLPCPMQDAPPPCRRLPLPCQMDLPAPCPTTPPPCIQMDIPTQSPCFQRDPCAMMDPPTPPPCRPIPTQPPCPMMDPCVPRDPCAAMDPPTPPPCRPIPTQPPYPMMDPCVPRNPCAAMDPPTPPPCLPQRDPCMHDPVPPPNPCPCGYYDAPAFPCGGAYDAAPVMNECEDGWTRYKESCYYVERQDKKSLDAAESACLALDSTLFVADSLDEYETIIDHAPKNTWTWLGLVRPDEDDVARWHTDASLDYKHLPWLIKPYSDSSNGWSSLSKCAAHWNPDSTVGKYNYYYPCSYSFYYVCERNATLANVKPKSSFRL